MLYASFSFAGSLSYWLYGAKRMHYIPKSFCDTGYIYLAGADSRVIYGADGGAICLLKL